MVIKHSKASQELARITAEYGAARRLAKKIGVGADRISIWARNLGNPSTKHRVMLLQYAGIGLLDWDEPAEESTNDVAPQGAA